MKRITCIVALILLSYSSFGEQIAIPPGIRLRVKMVTAIDTRTGHVGDVIEAVLVEPVQQQNSIALPVGTRLTGHVAAVSSENKKNHTHALLQLSFDELVLPDGRYSKTQASIQNMGVSEKVDANGIATIHPLSHDFAMKKGKELWLRVNANPSTEAAATVPPSAPAEPLSSSNNESRNANEPLKLWAGISPPRVIRQVEPEFTEEARKGQHQGTVEIRAIIGKDGHVRDAQVIKPLGWGLDEKALEAVNQWLFDPAVKDGKKVAVYVAINVNFQLVRNR